MTTLLSKTGIRSVAYYTACGPVETCDRCGQGIRNVACVTYKDGTFYKYGMDCIDKILKTAPNLRGLFRKNLNNLKRINDALEIFARKPEDMPRGHEYYGSGKYFVAHSPNVEKGGDICTNGGMLWHPIIDWEKNQSGNQYVSQGTPADWQAKAFDGIAKAKVRLEAKKAEIEVFLGRVLAKVTADQRAALLAEEVAQ